MAILRLVGLVLVGALVQGCTLLGYECPECCPRPMVAQAEPEPPPRRPAPDPCAGVIRLRGVNFDFDSARIRSAALPILDQAVDRLRQCGSERLRVEGHTDAIGSDAYNQDLSERRARSVRSYMVSRGIAASRIEAVGFGESRPVATNDTPEGRAMNRRVEVRFLE